MNNCTWNNIVSMVTKTIWIIDPSVTVRPCERFCIWLFLGGRQRSLRECHRISDTVCNIVGKIIYIYSFSCAACLNTSRRVTGNVRKREILSPVVIVVVKYVSTRTSLEKYYFFYFRTRIAIVDIYTYRCLYYTPTLGRMHRNNGTNWYVWYYAREKQKTY